MVFKKEIEEIYVGNHFKFFFHWKEWWGEFYLKRWERYNHFAAANFTTGEVIEINVNFFLSSAELESIYFVEFNLILTFNLMFHFYMIFTCLDKIWI